MSSDFSLKRLIASLLWTTCCLCGPLSAQDLESQEIASAQVSSDQAASSLKVGKTTLDEAEKIWEASNASTIRRGRLAIGGGSGSDGTSKVGLDQVELIDQRGVDFEGLPVARYAFVDGVLYAITAQLRDALPANRGEFKQLSADELEAMQKDLRRKYGNPTKTTKDMFAGKQRNIFIWNLRENELVLQVRSIQGTSLTLQNKALSQKVEKYRKAECRKHQANPNKPGLITEVCV